MYRYSIITSKCASADGEGEVGGGGYFRPIKSLLLSLHDISQVQTEGWVSKLIFPSSYMSSGS